MAKIEATSKTKFKRSGKTSPIMTELFKARTKKQVTVRMWAGKDQHKCGFSPLEKDSIVSVCDAILSAAGHTWYYIKTDNGHYGFVYADSTSSVSNYAINFLDKLANYHRYIKTNNKWFKYKFMGEVDSFTKAKDRVARQEKVGITCLVPIAWALHAMGIKKADGKSWVSGNYGSFKYHYTGGVKARLKRITDGKAIGKTVKTAVDDDLLKPGDIIAFKNKTHTVAYSGKDYYVYEGGHAAMKDGKYTGIKVSYSNYVHKISEILRWKE